MSDKIDYINNLILSVKIGNLDAFLHAKEVFRSLFEKVFSNGCKTYLFMRMKRFECYDRFDMTLRTTISKWNIRQDEYFCNILENKLINDFLDVVKFYNAESITPEEFKEKIHKLPGNPNRITVRRIIHYTMLPKEKEIIFWAYFMKQTTEEISKILCCQLNTVSERKRRGFLRTNKRVSEELDQTEEPVYMVLETRKPAKFSWLYRRR
jgi:hypothetical protein